ncbi:SpaA isopeptide-forming pilin-related protein [Kitasatospora sp. MMS16-BH015]|uniref:SpaA isopeptide-forming pilin-related protein n=1 Tax=Kitasatospora sp. MMS16-BH015 TaxID=2018025 RepID=UPI001C2C322A|nr:SpaA isopeptide-forming pilin-related protein [Kitasatospora sp. MMS16-BH015]
MASAVTVLAMCAGLLGLGATGASAAAGDGTVTVRVVREVNGNGAWDGAALEPGMAGVTVNLTDDAGTTISGTTAADGTVTLRPAGTALAGGRYRVQVINPKPGVLYSAFADRTGLTGAPNKLSSTEEFVDLSAGKNVSYTTALWNPGDYCQKNAPLVTACIRSDVTTDTGTRTLVSFPYNARGNDNQTTNLATETQTGALYGIGYSKQRRWIFSGAHAHRGSNYGPSGNGAIYLTDRATNATTLFATVPNTGTTAHNMTVDMDLGFTPAVGKEALGDVEVSEDGNDLWVINLADRQLYRYDATQRTATAPKAVYAIPQPTTACPAAGDWRPYGLGVQDGVVYVGGTCSGESTQSRADLRAIVRTFDPVAGAFGPVILDQRLDYPRPITYTVAPCNGDGWYPWSDTIPLRQDGTTCGATYTSNPEPMLSDIVVDTDGSLILSFRDRYGDQIGNAQRYIAGSGLLATPSAGGAMSRACPNAAGMFVMYENLGCGNTSTTRGGGYYNQQRTAFHYNALFSGIALSKVETTIASSSLDPDDVTTFTGGTAWTNRDGTRPVAGQMGNRLTSAFGKGGSMADLEVMCDEAPLQIGNRVWYDNNKNGIQDPSEPPVVGATVRLYNSAGTVVGTMQTTARGEYYFDDSNVTGGLKPNTAYTIKVDLAADYAPGGPLYQWVVTQPNAGSNTFIDNDGVAPAGSQFPQYSITTGGPGQNNHTYDFGYIQPTGTVQVTKTDPAGNPLAGATFQLWKDTNGTAGLQTTGTTPDTKVGTACTTGADGICTATVGVGTYYWQETAAPPGYLLPNPAVFGPLAITVLNYQTAATVTAIDQPMTGAVSVTKADPGGRPLAGAVFQLWKESNGTAGLQTTGATPDTMVGSPCTTPANGVCTATVGLGTYYWQETAAPNGFLLPTPAVFGPLTLTSANYQAGVTTTATDQPMTGTVKVTKTDPAGKVLAGAVFQLWQDTDGTAGLQTATDTRVGQPCTTPASGVCSATVGLGTYYWQETAPPDGYLLPTPAVFGPLTLTSANYTAGASATAVDQPMTGQVKVTKVDPAGKTLAGAVFQLWQDTDGTAGLQTATDTKVGQPCTTGADGVCSATVGLGTYYWQETTAPDGYQLPNPAVFGPLTLTSANAAQGVAVTATDRPIPGAVTITKQDPQGKVLAGAVFQLWRDTNGTAGLQTDTDTAVGTPCTTGANGICTATVDPGTYYWQETKAPDGFLLPTPAIFGPLVLTVQNSRQGVSATAVDQPMTGQVRVTKTNPAGAALAGAVFQLWQDTDGTSGLQTASDTKVGQPCTTGADGVCSQTVGLGTYYWQETQAPTGFLLPDPAVFGPLTLTSANYAAGVSVTAVDQPMTGVVKVTKVDPQGKVLAGAVFQLWQDTDGTSGLQTASDTKVGQPCTTGADGVCSQTVGLGTYYWQETAAPDGYLLPDPVVFGPLVLTPANYQAGVAVSVTDVPMSGTVKVTKTDPTGKALAGAVFQLWKETNGTDGLQTTGATPDTKVNSPCTTPASGFCSATVGLGTYYWEETAAPAGFLLPTPAVFGPLTLTSANYAAGVAVTAVDQPMTGQVKVTKVDPQGKVLAGAVFQLWQDTDGTSGLQTASDTKVGQPCTTGADGICSATVGLGTYYWEETAAPAGFLLPNPAVFGPLTLTSANYTAGVSVTATDQPMTGQVKVTKTDPAGKALAGAVFQLWQDTNGTDGLQTDADTKVGQPCTTPANGQCSQTVGLGTYYWQETAAPAGFLLPNPAVFGPLTLTSANYTAGVAVTAVDQPMTGTVKVTKVDPQGKVLAGAVFQLWQDTDGTSGLQTASDTKAGQPCTTGADGICSATVGLGTYYWEETAAPAGFLLPNPAVFGPLTLTSANYTAGVSVTATDQPMTGQVKVTKTDPAGKALAGAVFQLWQDTNGTDGLQTDADTKVGQPCTTPANGQCSQTVGLGTYYWQETAAPAGFLLPNPAVFGPLTLTSANYTAGVAVTAVDQPMTGTVKVTKVDPTGKVLAGAVFQLWQDTNGTAGLQTATDTKVGQPCTTPASGVCSQTVGLGSYYWEETKAPDGYVLPDPAVFGPLVLTSANYQAGVAATAVDQPATGAVSVLKTNPQGRPLPGAVFQLWQETNGTDGLQIDADTKVGQPCTTPANGQCSQTVGLGTYYWEEVKAPDGFQLPLPPVFGPLVLTMANYQAGVSTKAVDRPTDQFPVMGMVWVEKNDPQGKPLAGAVFQLWRETNGKDGLQPDGDTKVGDPCTTLATGICSAKVGLGTYYWQEVKAPAGYLLPDPAVFGPLVLTEANQAAGVGVKAVDQPQGEYLTLLKRDADSKAPLGGAVFQLWRETNGTPGLQPDGDTKVGDPCTTDAAGGCHLGPLPAGGYYLQEVKAPDGYLLPENPVTPVTLTGTGDAPAVVVEDRRKPVPLPKTGAEAMLAALFGTVLTVAGAALLRTSRRRRKV